MERILNISNFYITLWCLYYLQGLLYPAGSIISRLLLSIALTVSLLYFVLINLQKEQLPSVLKVLNLLILLFTIYGVIHILFGENNVLHVKKFEYLKAIYMSLLPIYPFYSFTKKGMLDEQVLKIWTLIFILIGIACFYKATIIGQQYASISYAYEADTTNNSGYTMLALIPMTLLYRDKPIVQYLLLGIVLFSVVLGMKRGAILIAGICTVWIFYKSFLDATIKGKSWILFLGGLLVMLIMSYITYLANNNDYFIYRLEQTQEGNSSYRNTLYFTLLHFFINDTTALTFLLGSGADATINIVGNYAHNDWLEIAINNGLIGAIIYATYWIMLFKSCRQSRPHKQQYIILSSFIIITFLKTLFSMSYNDMPIYLSIIMAWAIATVPTQIKQE